jgi:hypothetical protein
MAKNLPPAIVHVFEQRPEFSKVVVGFVTGSRILRAFKDVKVSSASTALTSIWKS